MPLLAVVNENKVSLIAPKGLFQQELESNLTNVFKDIK